MKTNILTCLFLALLACACSKSETDGTNPVPGADAQLQEGSLRIAVTPTLDCLPLYVAQQEGWFESAGLSVQLVPFQAQMDQDTAVAGGSVQGLTTDSERMAWLSSHGTPLQQVAPTSLFWQLLTNKAARLTLLSQLDDKMVAMTRYSATDKLAAHLVDSAGLQSERVFRIQVNDVGVRLSMLQNGIMDAMLLPEPQATVARLDGHPVLYSSGPGLGVLAFRQDVMADTARRHEVERLVAVFDAATDSIAARGLQHYRTLIANYCKVRPEVVDSIEMRDER